MKTYSIPSDGKSYLDYNLYVTSLPWQFAKTAERSISIDYGRERATADAFLEGFILVEDTLVEDKELTPLEKKIKDINDLKDFKLSKFAYDFGSPYGVLNLQLRDSEDRTNWLTLRTSVSELIFAGYGDTAISIRTEENITVPMTANSVAVMLRSMSQYGSDVLYNSWVLKDQAREAEDLNLVDITVGWPA